MTSQDDTLRSNLKRLGDISTREPMARLRHWASYRFARYAIRHHPLLSVGHIVVLPVGFLLLWTWSGFFGNVLGGILQILTIYCVVFMHPWFIDPEHPPKLRYIANLQRSLDRHDSLYRIIREVLTADRLLGHASSQYQRWYKLHNVGLNTDPGVRERFAALFSKHVPVLERTVEQCLVLCEIRDAMRSDPRGREDAAFSIAGLHSDTAAELKHIADDARMSPERTLEDIERSVSAFRTLERELQVLASPHRS